LRKILKYIKKVAMKFGISLQIGRLTSNKDLIEFINQLKPVKIDKNLIRLGSQKDGGYLVPDDLAGIEALFSPGVGMSSSLELDCAANRGIKAFMADASVEGPVEKHELFHFEKKFIGAIDNDEEFMTIEKWIDNADISSDSDLILQMDIEGYEYETIYSMSLEKLKRFRIILVEFHQMDMLWNSFYFEKFKNVFLKLTQTHYVVHIHPNNCCEPINKDGISIPPVMEFTFIRKDRVKVDGYVEVFPHPLDVDCAAKKPFSLPKCWYGMNDIA